MLEIFVYQDLVLRGFWLQKWLASSDNMRDCRVMIDHLLSLVRDNHFKYEYVSWFSIQFFQCLAIRLLIKFIKAQFFPCRMELVSFDDFNIALDKALGKLGSQPKQILRFWNDPNSSFYRILLEIFSCHHSNCFHIFGASRYGDWHSVSVCNFEFFLTYLQNKPLNIMKVDLSSDLVVPSTMDNMSTC